MVVCERDDHDGADDDLAIDDDRSLLDSVHTWRSENHKEKKKSTKKSVNWSTRPELVMKPRQIMQAVSRDRKFHKRNGEDTDDDDDDMNMNGWIMMRGRPVVAFEFYPTCRARGEGVV